MVATDAFVANYMFLLVKNRRSVCPRIHWLQVVKHAPAAAARQLMPPSQQAIGVVFVDQIDDDLLNLRSVHENLKDRAFEFVLDRSRPPAGILLQEPPRTEVELGYTFAIPVINLPRGESYVWNVSFDEYL
jgi:hypothetical protein